MNKWMFVSTPGPGFFPSYCSVVPEELVLVHVVQVDHCYVCIEPIGSHEEEKGQAKQFPLKKVDGVAITSAHSIYTRTEPHGYT